MPVKLIPLFEAAKRKPDVQWIADGRILRGSCNVIYGPDGIKKSFLCSGLAASVTNPKLGGHCALGDAVLGAEEPGHMRCVYLCNEDPEITTKLIMSGATNDVLVIATNDDVDEDYDPYSLRIGTAEFEAVVARSAAGGLVIIDPVKSFVPTSCNLNSEMDVNTYVFQPLRRLSLKYDNITWVLVSHTNKGSGTGREKISGSAEWSSSSRSCLAVGPYTCDANGDVVTMWCGSTKSSLLDSHGLHPRSFEFKIGEHGAEYIRDLPYGAEQLQQMGAAAKSGDGIKEGSAKAAERDILAYLGECGVPVSALEMQAHLDEIGYRKSMYHRAVKALVDRKQVDRYAGDGNRWWLSLPDKAGGGKTSTSLPSNSGTEAKNGAS